MYTNKELQEVINYLKENEGLFNNLIEELDAYNGYLSDDRVWEMDCFDEFFSNKKPLDLLSLIGEFDVNDEYFYVDGCTGAINSTSEKDYLDFLDEYFINEVLEYREHLYIEDYGLNLLLDEVEKSFNNDTLKEVC